MSYAVKEIFLTLQGEGAHAGRAAVFCRFAGCNLWSGREQDRASATCQFCDTDFVGTDGTLGGRYATADDLADTIAAQWTGDHGNRYVVLTGGEPMLQIDAALIDALHARDFTIAVETNGTIAPPPGLDWICVSPKAGSDLIVRNGHELKLVYPQPGALPELGGWKIDSAPADLLRSRPEIARAEANVLTAAGELAIAHADRFPQIGLGGSINWSTDIDNNHSHSSTPNAIDSFGPELSIPLFDWGIRLAAQHARDHQLKASVLAYRQAVLQGVSEVETALGSVRQQRLREQHSLHAWQASQRVDQAVQTRAELQLASPLERTESELGVDQAALDLADARAAHDLAYVALFKALGGAPLPAAGDPDAVQR